MTHQIKQGPAFNVPVLPHTAPEANQPHGLSLPLMPHQLRALNRCLVIEQDGSLLNQDFGHRFDYKSRGGCLADSVGTGKTATSIGLVLSGKEDDDDVERGGTLVVAPAHLIPQWKHEIHKFAGDSIQVLVGKQEYNRMGHEDLPFHYTRRIVLIAVDDVLNEPKVWYDWRRVYTSEPGKKGKGGGGQLIKKVPAEKMEVYRKAALFSVKSPKGPCTYSGWVYTGLLHLPHKPWRRVIYDEIQDLVSEGTDSQKNLLQLSRTAQHVWLLSATPFPHGNSSVYANHELLGFCRLRLDIPSAEKLDADHVFERIKRQLYIRSPRHVADQAVTASQLVTRTTQYIPQLDLEERFYHLENKSICENFHTHSHHHFDPVYYPLRQMTVHPEASEKLRQQMTLANNNNTTNNRVRPVSASGSVNQACQRAILAAKARLRTIEGQDLKRAAKQLRDATRSLELAEKILVHRARPVATSVFAVGNSGTDVTRASREEEKKIVHDHYCACTGGLGSTDCYADRKIFFRIMRDEHSASEAEFIHGGNATEKVIQYFDGFSIRGDHTMRSKSLQHYITSSKRSVAMRKENLDTHEKEKRELLLRIETLSQASKPGAVKDESDALAALHGSKPAALVRFLQTVTANGEQVIVFSYWHDTLKLIGQTLSRCGLRSVFCSGNGAAMALALQAFTTNISPILLLSAQSKASGANLQCASHVILLDPAGSSAEHGLTLEEQAVGRAVRMGQLKPVTVTRFCVTGTIEEDLFSEIDSAAVSAKKGSCDKYVITDFNSKAAAAPKREEHNSKKSKEQGEEDSDVKDVKVTDTVSPDEQLRRKFQKAQENGNVISLDDGNDDMTAVMPSTSSEEEEDDLSDIKVTDTVSPNERIRRKFQNAQENGNVICLDPDDDKEDCDPNVKLEPKSKRMRSEQPEESKTSSVQSDTETAANASVTPAPPGSAVASVSSSGSSVGGTPDSSDHGNSGKSGFSAVRDLLRRLDLSEYTHKFSESGLDNLEWLYQFSQDSAVMEKLVAVVGFKPGHAVRFQFGLSKEASTHKLVAVSTAAAPDSSWI